MTDDEAVDRAYAKLTAQATRQRQVWHVEPATSSEACANRLTAITAADGYVFSVNSLPDDVFDIIWYVFEN